MDRTVLRVLAVSALSVTPAVATTGALAAERIEVRSRDVLTAQQSLRGVMTFSRPSAWREDAKSGVYTARFTRAAESGCTIRISASIRGKATRATARQQVVAAVGPAPSFGSGTGRVGPFASHEVEPHTIYGILVTRVATRRFGQLRIFASHSGCSAQTKSETAEQINRVLRGAGARLRVT